MSRMKAGTPASRPDVDAGTLLSVRDLSVEFATEHGWVRVLEDVSFDLPREGSIGLVGESGSGKSVTALSVLGLIPTPPGRIVSGEVMFDGTDLLQMSQRQLRRIRGNDIGMVFQEPMASLNPAFTVGEQIAETVRLHRKGKRSQAWDRAIEVLDLVGIPSPRSRAKDYPHQFSGGMAQRVMIAMALACEPRLLIADESTTALDVTIQAKVLELLRDMQQRFNMSVLLVTHDFGIVADFCDQALVMYAGQVVEDAPVDGIFDSPRHPYTEGLLASMPQSGNETEDGLMWSIAGTVPPAGSMPPGCRFHPRCPYAKTPMCVTDPIELLTDQERRVRCVRADEIELEGTS